MRVSSRRLARIGGIALVGVGLAAGASTSARSVAAPVSSDPPPADLADVTIEIGFPRYLQAMRTPDGGEVLVSVDNRSGAALEIEHLMVESPLFEPTDAAARTGHVAAGQRLDFRVPLGAAVCPAPDGNTTVAAIWRVADADAAPARLAADATAIERLHHRECGTRAVLAAATVTLDLPDSVDPAADEVPGDVMAVLSLHRVGASSETITVIAVGGSVVITLAPLPSADGERPSPPLLTLAESDTDAQLPVRMRIVRCDAHAIGESKKTMIMMMWARLDDGADIPMEIVPTPALADRLAAEIDDCAHRRT